MGLDDINDKGLRRRIKQHVVAKKHEFFAVVQPGFEKTAKAELKGLGEIEINELTEGGIGFTATLSDCWRLNLLSRTASRFLMRLARFRAENFRKLEKKTVEFPWELHLADGAGIVFSTSCRKSRLYHTGKIEETVFSGITRRMEGCGMKISAPSPLPEEKQGGDQILFIRFNENICTLSLDTSGELLYKRGYRREISEAPIRETLAALIFLEAGIGNYDLVIDPMCGSGAFSLEAAGILTGKAPAADREFAFMNWPSFKRGAFEYMKKELTRTPLEGETTGIKVLASDLKEENLHITSNNLERAGLSAFVQTGRVDFLRERIPLPAGERGLIVINPPYGKRLAGEDETFFRKLGRTIRENYPACGYAIISPSLEHEKIMGLPYDRKVLFMNGGIRVGLIVKDGN